MSLTARVLLGFGLLLTIAAVLGADAVRRELRPRYLETVEESLNDTAQTLAALLETQVVDGRIDTGLLGRVLDEARARRLNARIFDVTKTAVDLHAYVTDAAGTVIYDSRGPSTVGRDFSRWNDVLLTLRGEYGARATRIDPADPATTMLHVAAPIRAGGEVIGVVTVIKANDSVTPFVDAARSRLLTGGLYTAVAFTVLGLVLSFWISRPLTRLTRHVSALRTDPSTPMPDLTVPELRDLAREFVGLWEELRGRRYVERYVQSLTHELKGPLSSVRASAELLEEELPAEQRHAFQRTILRESRRIEGIVQRMLELSALENRSELREVEPVVLAELIREVVEACAARLEAARLRVRCLVADDLTVNGERFLLHHALANLVDNAIRFSPEGGTIEVEARPDGATVRVTVSDQGPGLPEYALARAFDRFFSLPDPRMGAKGSGLGLPFVREAATLHGGSIDLVNRDCGGAQAVLVLPV